MKKFLIPIACCFLIAHCHLSLSGSNRLVTLKEVENYGDELFRNTSHRLLRSCILRDEFDDQSRDMFDRCSPENKIKWAQFAVLMRKCKSLCYLLNNGLVDPNVVSNNVNFLDLIALEKSYSLKETGHKLQKSLIALFAHNVSHWPSYDVKDAETRDMLEAYRQLRADEFTPELSKEYFKACVKGINGSNKEVMCLRKFSMILKKNHAVASKAKELNRQLITNLHLADKPNTVLSPSQQAFQKFLAVKDVKRVMEKYLY